MPNNKELIDKVNEELSSFSKRFYTNEFLQGLAVFVGSSAILAIILSFGEYLLRSNTSIRQILFYSFAALELAGLVYLVLIPGLRIFGKAGAKTEKEMSSLVGKRVKEIDDKLVNILTLKEMMGGGNKEILDAAINQKSKDILKWPFRKSATVKKGLRFIQGAGIVLVLLILMGMSFPDVINYGAKRILYYEENIVPPAPFQFIYGSSEFDAVVNESFEMDFTVEGDLIPKQVFVEVDGNRELAIKASVNAYRFVLPSVKKSFSLQLYAEGYSSDKISVRAIERPSINDFEVRASYPEYLGREEENFGSSGNISVPEGAVVKWLIGSDEESEVLLTFNNGTKVLQVRKGIAIFDSLFKRDARYGLSAHSSNGLRSDSISYFINVLPDEVPVIEVEEIRDSLETVSRFVGRYSDDHGISNFQFGYFKKGEKDPEFRRIEFNPTELSREFVYEIDWSSWGLTQGEGLKCFFEVWDNDGVNGRKHSRSRLFYFEVPDKEELKKSRNDLSKEIEEELEAAIEESKEINREIEELRKDVIQKKELDWTEKKRIEDLLRRNEELKQRMEDILKKNERKNTYENKIKPNPELMRKREELQELMEKVMDEETLKKIKELEELMEKINKEQINEKIEDMQLSNDQLEKELDRSLELFKQLEYEMKLDEVIEKIDEIKKDQEELREKTTENGIDKEDVEEQKKLEEEFEKWKEDYTELQKINEELENKNKVEEIEEEKKSTEESMKEASESMEKNQKKKSSESQKKAEQSLDEIKQALTSMQAQMQEQNAEDIQSLRNTLENLVELSFNQERLMDDMKGMRGNDPRFNELTREQRAILEGLKIVEDSLQELSKRITQIAPMVNRELGTSKQNMDRAMKSMTERKVGSMAVQQQQAMTSLNNLALLLDEIVNQLQQQMMQSSGECKKPGSSKPSASSMKKLQKELNKQLDDMKKMMEEKKEGGKGKGEGKSGEAEKLAKMAAQQAKIREELRKLEESSSDQEAKEIRKLGDLMEETERDIVNREISRETLMRQEEILTKLLESENAERERDTDEKRESQEGREKKNGNLLDLDEYYKARDTEHEQLIKESIKYKQYYKEKVEEYFKNVSG